jgi:hypothetical protein
MTAPGGQVWRGWKNSGWQSKTGRSLFLARMDTPLAVTSGSATQVSQGRASRPADIAKAIVAHITNLR